MCATLDTYLKSNNILCTNQFGFCKNSNTSDAIIIEFLDYVYSSLDKKQSTIGVYLDFSKALDTVNTLTGWAVDAADVPMGEAFSAVANVYAISNFLPSSLVLDNLFWYQIVRNQIF